MAQYFFTRMRRRILHGILFDHEAEVIHDRAPLREVPELRGEQYFVRGRTALLDAVGGAAIVQECG